MTADTLRMVGDNVVDLKKNTASAKRVNDRLRRRQKRLEREELKARLAAGEFYCSFWF